jgi:CHAD domain-containing protein
MIYMKSGKIINVFAKRFKKVKKHYNKLLEDFEIEEMHGFRLEMKKLRAFIRLINTNIPEQKKIKIGGKIKSFYNTAGNIRNLQLHQQRVSYICDEMLLEKPVLYLQLLHNEENKQKKKAGRIADKISYNKFRKKIIDLVPDKLKAKSVQRFVIQKQHTLLELLFLRDYSDEALHEIRKVLKDLLYVWKYISSYLPATLPASFTNKKNIEVFADKLGEFHDLCIALNFFKPFYIDKIAVEEENKILLSVKQKLEETKGEMKEEINTLLNHVKQEMEKENILQEVHVV